MEDDSIGSFRRLERNGRIPSETNWRGMSMRQIINLRKRLLKIATQIVPVQGAYFVF